VVQAIALSQQQDVKPRVAIAACGRGPFTRSAAAAGGRTERMYMGRRKRSAITSCAGASAASGRVSLVCLRVPTARPTNCWSQ